MAEKLFNQIPDQIVDDQKVRLGDVAPYTEPATKPAATPREIADDQKVRMGDGGIYFAPAIKAAPADIEDGETVRLGDYSPYL